MAQSSGRVSCPKCGANNFETVTLCWKCGATIGAGGQAPRSGQAPLQPSPGQQVPQAAFTMPGRASLGAAERAALWLGLLFPYFGLPVGLVFIMLDDDRKQQLGRICVLWSIISLVLHVVAMLVTALGAREMLLAMLQGVRGAASRPGDLGGGGGY